MSMKKIVLLALLIFISLPAIAADDTLNEQAKLLYADNNITESFNALLSIPEEFRKKKGLLKTGFC